MSAPGPDLRVKSVRFKLSQAGLDALAGGSKTEVALTAIGEAIAEQALRYGGRFSRKRWFTETRREASQVVVRAGTDQPAAHWDEWGNVNRAPRAPLRRALQSLRLWQKTKESSQ
jgi:hypothetical protein